MGCFKAKVEGRSALGLYLVHPPPSSKAVLFKHEFGEHLQTQRGATSCAPRPTAGTRGPRVLFGRGTCSSEVERHEFAGRVEGGRPRGSPEAPGEVEALDNVDVGPSLAGWPATSKT